MGSQQGVPDSEPLVKAIKVQTRRLRGPCSDLRCFDHDAPHTHTHTRAGTRIGLATGLIDLGKEICLLP